MVEKNLPKHGVVESEFAPSNLSIPKLPSKNKKTPPPVSQQIMMAEVVVPKEIIDASENELLKNEKLLTPNVPAVNIEEVTNANTLFAETCSVSLRGLIKIIPFKLDNYEITFKVNDSQDMIIGDLRVQWQNFLRKHFKQTELTLIFEIDNTIEHKRMAYTAPEQLNEMLEDNPKLQYLVNKFKLKIKY